MHIPPFVTSRINATFKELSVGSIIELCKIPVEHNELGITKSIEAFLLDSNLALAHWTAQERYAAVIHYQVHLHNKGEAFNIGPDLEATIIDYLGRDGADHPITKNKYSVGPDELVYRFELDAGSDDPDQLEMRPLTTAWIEAVERAVLRGDVRGVSNKDAAWEMACIAAQVHAAGTDMNVFDEVSIDSFIKNNIETLLAMPASAYKTLLGEFYTGTAIMDHIVRLRVFDDGFVLMPWDEGKGGEGLPPYRFQFDSLISEDAFEAWGGYDVAGV